MDYKIALTPGLMCALNLVFAKRFLDIQPFKENKFLHFPTHNIKRDLFHDGVATEVQQLRVSFVFCCGWTITVQPFVLNVGSFITLLSKSETVTKASLSLH